MTLHLKKYLLAAALTAMAALSAAAAGQWTVYPVFAGSNKLVTSAGDRVYFAGTGLFSYDPTTGEQESYGDRLNGRVVRLMRHNPDRGYLFVGYEGSNIDLVYDDGHVVNMPQIAISGQAPCEINDVVFDGRDIYVATTFGLVKFNESTAEVTESGIYGINTTGLAMTPTRLILHADNWYRSAPRGASITKLSGFTENIYSPVPLETRLLSDTHLLCRTALAGEYALRLYTIDFDNNMLTGEQTLSDRTVPPLLADRDGTAYVQIDGALHEVGTDGTLTRRVTLPDEIAGDVKAIDGTMPRLWSLGPKGLCNVEVGDGGSLTVLTDRFMPDASYTLEACFFAPSKQGRSLYVYNYGTSAYKPFGSNHMTPLAATKIDLRTGSTSYATPYPVDGVNPEVAGWQATSGRYPLAPTMIAVDPDDDDTYWLSTGNDGVYKIRSGERIGVINSDNAPINPGWGPSTFAVHIDRGGNLWVIGYGGEHPAISVLPSAKRTRPVSEITVDDWISIDADGFSGGNDVAFLECERSGMIFIACHGGDFRMLAYDTNNTPSNFDDDKSLVWTSLTDQDGKTWTPTRRICFTEDRSGRVWFGTDEGIYQFGNPRQMTTAGTRVQKTKVPRNDGTNEADYLAGNDRVFGIAVDSRGRKWLATENSGLVCTNETGSAILATYDPQNSPLADNCVLNVWADPSSGDIYAGTLTGLLRFRPDVESAAESFDDILAYPNPVRPEFSGYVTVRGLMDNTLVKIADAAGGVVSQGRAENGTYRWDVCDASGRRVRTGVYYVFVSQNASGSSTGAVTKILVVN